MKCTVSGELLLSYSLNELQESEREILEKHLVDCFHCQEILDEMRKWQQVWNEADHTPSFDFVDSIMEQILIKEPKVKQMPKKNNRATFMNVFVALVASFILIFTGIFSSMDQQVAKASNAFTESTQQIQQASDEGLTWLDQANQQVHNLVDLLKFQSYRK